MDAIRRHDIEWARQTPPGEKLAAALDMMRAGIQLKRSTIRTKHPLATEDEIDSMLRAWLEANG